MMNNDNVAPGDKAMILLQSLICYLREKNVLSRADIEELRNSVEARMATPDSGLSCATALVAAAVNEMREDRKSVVEGKSVSVRVELGGRGYITKKKSKQKQ